MTDERKLACYLPGPDVAIRDDQNEVVGQSKEQQTPVAFARERSAGLALINEQGTDTRGGKLLRLRSPENVVAEMAELWRNAGGRAIFCFHDDNVLLPRPQDSWERLSAIRQALDRHGVGEVGLVGKCRPDALTSQPALKLRGIGAWSGGHPKGQQGFADQHCMSPARVETCRLHAVRHVTCGLAAPRC